MRMALLMVILLAGLTCGAVIAPPHANTYTSSDDFRVALNAHHKSNPDVFEDRCVNVMRMVLMSIVEIDPIINYAPDERASTIRERTLINLSAFGDGWDGASINHLKAFEDSCDSRLRNGLPTGPGDAS